MKRQVKARKGMHVSCSNATRYAQRRPFKTGSERAGWTQDGVCTRLRRDWPAVASPFLAQGLLRDGFVGFSKRSQKFSKLSRSECSDRVKKESDHVEPPPHQQVRPIRVCEAAGLSLAIKKRRSIDRFLWVGCSASGDDEGLELLPHHRKGATGPMGDPPMWLCCLAEVACARFPQDSVCSFSFLSRAHTHRWLEP
jgi:hypothetical protein